MTARSSQKQQAKAESREKEKLPPRIKVSREHLDKLFSRKAKSMAPEHISAPLGPNIEVPPEFFAALKTLTDKLLRTPEPSSKTPKGAGHHNILSVHIGQKRVNKKPTGGLAIIVHPQYRIPKRIKVGDVFVPVDVQKGTIFKPHAVGGDFCGLSASSGVGAVGCFCFKLTTDPNTGETGRIDLLLTNNHVIGAIVNADPGSQVFEFDGTLPSVTQGDLIAHFIKMGTVGSSSDLSIDAALANAEDTPESNMNQHEGGFTFNDEIVVAHEKETVFMNGPVTKGTQGIVKQVLPSFSVDYSKYPIGRPLLINKVVLIDSVDSSPFSEEGDSGSLIINASGNPVALLIGGSGNQSIAGDLLTIQKNLNFDGIHSVP
jgi:hypothetical protein